MKSPSSRRGSFNASGRLAGRGAPEGEQQRSRLDPYLVRPAADLTLLKTGVGNRVELPPEAAEPRAGHHGQGPAPLRQVPPPWCGHRPSRHVIESPSRNRAYTRRPWRTSRADPGGKSSRPAAQTQPVDPAGARPPPRSSSVVANASPPFPARNSSPSTGSIPQASPEGRRPGRWPERSVRVAEPDVQGPQIGLEPRVLDRQQVRRGA